MSQITPYSDYHEILPGLFLGGSPRGSRVDDPDRSHRIEGFELDPRPFDTILTLYPKAYPAGYGVEERRFGFPDDLARGVLPEYEEAILELAEWAHQRWQQGRRVLIRCFAGENRSGLLMLLVLQLHGMRTDEAVTHIRTVRDSCRPLHNELFVEFARSKQRD